MDRHIVYMVQNDTGPPIDFELIYDDGTIPNLAGATVNFYIKRPDTGAVSNSGHTACSVTDAAKGKCRYTFVAGDIPIAGKFLCDVELIGADGKKQTEYNYTEIRVRAENA